MTISFCIIPALKYSNRNDWFWMSPKRPTDIENGCYPVFFTKSFIFTHHSLLISFSISSEPCTKLPTPHTSFYSTYFLSFNNQMTKLKYCYSHPKSFVVIMFWIVLFMILNHTNTHTLQIHFSIQLPSFLPKCIP